MAKGTTAWTRTRVMKLWLFWSVVYFVGKLVQAFVTDKSLAMEFHPWMVLTGPILPLWFLPFIYVANGLVASYQEHTHISRPWIEGFALATGAIICIVMLNLSPGIPFAQWCVGGSAVFLGIAVFRARRHFLQLIMVLLAVGALYLASSYKEAKILLFAAPIVTFALLFAPSWKSDIANRIGALALPVYILHSGISAVLLMAAPDISAFPKITVVVVLSTALGILLQRLPFTRRYI